MSYECFSLKKPDYASFGYVKIPPHSVVMSHLRHLDVVGAKTGLNPCGLELFLYNKPRSQDSVQRN